LAWALYRAARPALALAASDSSLARAPASPTGAAQRSLILRALGRAAEGDSLIAVAAEDRTLLAPHVRAALH
jgi:hypothetical protein